MVNLFCDCISSNLDLCLIIHLQGKRWTGANAWYKWCLFLYSHCRENTVALTKRLEEKVFFVTSDLSSLFANALLQHLSFL